MSSRVLIQRIPRIVKSVTLRGSRPINHRFFATETTSRVEDVVENVETNAPTQSGIVENGTVSPSVKTGKNGDKKKGQSDKKKVKPRTNSAAASAIGVQTDNSLIHNDENEDDKEIEIVTTRLTDNHPLTPKDRNPRYYLSHLTEDQLEDNVPVFESDRSLYPDEYSRDVAVSAIDENGNEVTEIRHLSSTKEEGLRELGFTPVTDKMFGYHYGVNKLPGVDINFGDDEKTPLAKDGKEGELEEFENKEPENNEYKQIDEDSARWFGTPVLPGSETQLEYERERSLQQAYAQDIRKEHRRMVLGYDNRLFNNSEPWVDTHRMEAIDARLHEIHLQRASGELEYPIEKDAMEEMHRIFKEEEAALQTIELLANGRKTKQTPFSTRGKSIRSRLHKPGKKASIQSDKDLESMDVDAIPVERLYEARRIELEKLRMTHYEDYDLSFLMEKSGKVMKSKRKAASLYEERHGAMDMPSEWETMNPVVGVKHLSKDLTEEEKAILRQEVYLYKKYGRMDLETTLGLYQSNVHVISPEMMDVMKSFNQEGVSGDDSTPGLTNELFSNGNNNKYKLTKDMNTRVKESEKVISYDATVDKEMSSIQRDNSKPLEDVEVGLNKQGDAILARRKHPSAFGTFEKDKNLFMKKFDELLNKEITEEDKEAVKSMVLTQEDIEAARAAAGIPKDVSNKEFYKKYIRAAKKNANAGDIVSELMTGYSLADREKIVKDLKLESEQDIEDYLMDTFTAHEATGDQLMSPEERETIALLQEVSRKTKEAEKFIEDAKAAKKGEGEAAAPAEGDAAAPAEGDAAAPAEGEVPAAEATPAPAEGDASAPAEEEADIVDPYLNMSLEESINALRTRARQDQERANLLVSQTPNDLMRGHIVDALEYSDQVYVHEKNRAMMYRMYQEGISPEEIGQTFGYDQRRVYAILRLMKNREAHKKAGTYSDKPVEDLEASENVFAYEYRDYPPADFKKLERRKKVPTVPSHLPKFYFLKDGDDEAAIMKEVDAMVSKKNAKQNPVIQRQGLPIGSNTKAANQVKHSCKMAIMDLSKGANKKVVISDIDGTLREPTKEESIHRSWNRKALRDNKRLLEMGL